MNILGVVFLYCAVTATCAQKLEEPNIHDVAIGDRRSTGYGLLRPGYQQGYNGYNNYRPGYNNYQGYQPGYNNQAGYGGYQGGYQQGYPGGQYAGYQGGYQNNFAGPYGGYPGGFGYPNAQFGGYRPNRPGYDYRPGLTGANLGYPGYNNYQAGYNRPGYQAGYPGNQAGYPGNQGYVNNYSDNWNDFRYAARKVADDKQSDEKST